MFKNITLYRIAPGWSMSIEAMETALQAARFAPCGPSQDKSIGWAEPRGQAHGALVESVGGQRILKLIIQTRSVPSSAVREKAQLEADRIEAATGRKPGKKELKSLREDARLALLPQAFARQSSLWVWLDVRQGWLITDASSPGKTDELITALVKSLDNLPLSLVQTQISPQSAMTQWLATANAEQWPPGFSVERECELKSQDQEKSVVKFTRHNLLIDEIGQHIAQGKLPTRVAMRWDGRIAFVLTESLQLKKLAFLDGVFDDRPSPDEDGFDADVALVTGELTQLIPALIAALGGELPMGQAGPSESIGTGSQPPSAAVAHTPPPPLTAPHAATARAKGPSARPAAMPEALDSPRNPNGPPF